MRAAWCLILAACPPPTREAPDPDSSDVDTSDPDTADPDPDTADPDTSWPPLDGFVCDPLTEDVFRVAVLQWNWTDACWEPPHFVARPAALWAGAYVADGCTGSPTWSAQVLAGGCAFLPVGCGPEADPGFLVAGSTCPHPGPETRGLCGDPPPLTSYWASRPYCACEGDTEVPISGHYAAEEGACWTGDTRMHPASWRAWACADACMDAPSAYAPVEGGCEAYNSTCADGLETEGVWYSWDDTCPGYTVPYENRCE